MPRLDDDDDDDNARLIKVPLLAAVIPIEFTVKFHYNKQYYNGYIVIISHTITDLYIQFYILSSVHGECMISV